MDLAHSQGGVDSCVHSRISQTHKVSKLEGVLGVICTKHLEAVQSDMHIWIKIPLLPVTSLADLSKSQNPLEPNVPYL